jgi:hypothetical protein
VASKNYGPKKIPSPQFLKQVNLLVTMIFRRLLKLTSSLPAVVLTGTILYALFYALAFVQLYFKEHPYKVASEWIFENIPRGSKIVSPHWDDKVPVGIPGHDTSIYQMHSRDFELPVYERDSQSMIEAIVRKIAQADYITFATPRAVDSIPRISDEYPNTTALLRLLWGEKIGFNFVHSSKNRPALFGFSFNDDLADESFSVYDHPKVVVFKNEERLSSEVILGRIKDVAKFEPLPDMNQMLLMDSGGWVPKSKWWNPSWSFFFKLLTVTLLLGLSIWVLIFRRILARLGAGALGLGIFFGVILAALIGWIAAMLNIIPFTRAGGIALVGILIVGAVIKLTLNREDRLAFKKSVTGGSGALGAFVLGAIVAYLMRSSDRLLFGIGDGVDGAYLSYIMRSMEPWPWDLFRPGERLSSALTDRVLLAWLLRVVGIPLELAVDAAFVVLGSLMGALLYSIMSYLTSGRNRQALLAVVITAVPVVYLLHLIRDSSTQGALETWRSLPIKGQHDLISFVRERIQGTPVIIEGCDPGASINIGTSLGLPIFSELKREGSDADPQRLCDMSDPQRLFDGMMAAGVELFVTQSGGAAGSDSARQRYEQLSSRRDLFAKVFDDQTLSLFVSAFSSYYPKANSGAGGF